MNYLNAVQAWLRKHPDSPLTAEDGELLVNVASRWSHTTGIPVEPNGQIQDYFRQTLEWLEAWERCNGMICKAQRGKITHG